MVVNSLRIGAVTLLLAALHGCGGGSGGSSEPVTSKAPGAIEGSGKLHYTNIGAITALDAGRITVNDVTVSFAGTTVDVDGRAAAVADLQLGHVVTLRGDTDSAGTPTSVATASADLIVAGPIATLDVANNQFAILGQRVAIDAETNIVGQVPGRQFGGLAVGDDVEVSGFADSAGVIFARRIEPRRSTVPLLVSGAVAGLDSTNKRMTVNGQAVDYSGAVLTGFGSVALDGATVQVDGDLVTSGVLHATEVKYRDLRVSGTVGDVALLQGWVTRFASSADFDVDGHKVTTTSSTVTSGPWGDHLGIVRLDAFVSVRGKLASGGVVEATEITTNNVVTVNARITSVDADGIWVTGRVFHGGGKCEFDSSVIAVDDEPADWRALQVGDRVTIHEQIDPQSIRPAPAEGWPRPTRAPVCKIITVTHNLRGPVDSIDADSASLVVMGQRVWLAPETFVLGVDGSGRRAALESLVPGDPVQVTGLVSAEGETVASTITRAPAGANFRITSLAQDVDPALKQLQVGSLTVDYSGASLVGFGSGGPVAGRRLVVIAQAPPVGGLLHATAIRSGAAPLRGEINNLQFINGLVTRFASASDYDIDGRRTEPLPVPPETNPYWTTAACDPGYMHANMPMRLLAVWPDEDTLWQVHTMCHVLRVTYSPSSVWSQQLGYSESGFWSSTPANVLVSGRVDAVDFASRSFRTGGLTVHVGPATLVSQVIPPVYEDYGSLSPRQLTDLAVGRVVKFPAHLYGVDGALVDSVGMTGTAESPGTTFQGALDSTARPDLVIGGVPIHTTAQTLLRHLDTGTCSWVVDAPDDFWNGLDAALAAHAEFSVHASTVWDSGQWVATSVDRDGPDPDHRCN